MTDLDAKLEQARERANGYGNLRGLKETADDYLKGIYAQVYEDAPDGTVAEKDAWVRRQERYRLAVEEKGKRYAEWTAAEIFMKILFAEVEKYRSDLSYQKHIDEAHR